MIVCGAAAAWIPSGTLVPAMRSGPVAGSAEPALIVHVYLPLGAALASQVQSTAVPVPVCCATCAPAAFLIETTHGTVEEMRARKRKRFSTSSTRGSKSFGSPIERAFAASAFSRP